MTEWSADKTARLAAAFGMILLKNSFGPEPRSDDDMRKARELSVLARVLENRLAETRRNLHATARPPAPVRPAA